MALICCYRHHAKMLTITMVLAGRPTSAGARPPEISRGPFCAADRAERECGNENLPEARQGSLCEVVRAWRRGGIDNAGNGEGQTKSSSKTTTLSGANCGA
eukprot:15469322-Alexandrium_andersonii.AAC.1